MRILLYTPSDNVQLAMMFLVISKKGFRMEHQEEGLTKTGLEIVQSVSNNMVSQISQLHLKENKRDYTEAVK